MNIKSQIANFITLCNLFLGCAAIVQCFNGTFESMRMASYYIALAGLVDFMDGFVARLLKVQSELGKQLDSLADVISFGAAPGFILFQVLNYDLSHNAHSQDPIRYFVFLAFLIPMAAAYRLGKFNLDPEQSLHFKGLPTPAMALIVATIPLQLLQNRTHFISNLMLSSRFITVLIFLLCVLMISKVPMMSLKPAKGGFKANLYPILLLLGILLLAYLFSFGAGLFALVLYILLSQLHAKTMAN